MSRRQHIPRATVRALVERHGAELDGGPRLIQCAECDRADYIAHRSPRYSRERATRVETGIFHIDHIHPVSRGGTNDIDNLRFLCDKCNLRKGARA